MFDIVSYVFGVLSGVAITVVMLYLVQSINGDDHNDE